MLSKLFFEDIATLLADFYYFCSYLSGIKYMIILIIFNIYFLSDSLLLYLRYKIAKSIP